VAQSFGTWVEKRLAIDGGEKLSLKLFLPMNVQIHLAASSPQSSADCGTNFTLS